MNLFQKGFVFFVAEKIILCNCSLPKHMVYPNEALAIIIEDDFSVRVLLGQ